MGYGQIPNQAILEEYFRNYCKGKVTCFIKLPYLNLRYLCTKLALKAICLV